MWSGIEPRWYGIQAVFPGYVLDHRSFDPYDQYHNHEILAVYPTIYFDDILDHFSDSPNTFGVISNHFGDITDHFGDVLDHLGDILDHLLAYTLPKFIPFICRNPLF